MFSALDSNNNLVDIDTAIQNPNEKYFCRACSGELIVKNGNVRMQHFAHKTKSDCDDYDNDMSEWHREWQKRFPLKNREVIIKMDVESPFYDRFDKVTRRADVLCYGHVIEFQNSPITSFEFDERNWFYNYLGYKVIWIFNMIDLIDNDKILCYDEWHNRQGDGGKYSWNYSSKTFVNFDSVGNDVILIFQFGDYYSSEPDKEQSYLEKIIWAIASNDDEKDTNFKRFVTSYKPSNLTELMEMLKRKEI